MSYIGNEPTSVAFLTDSFSGTGSQTAFTLSAAPANTSSILVAVSGVLQDPTTYSTTGTTLTFSAAPPSGTGNISVRFLGIPASGVTTTAYRTQTEFTATAGQTTFSVPSYTPGFIDVYRNGVLLASTNFVATNGTTVVLNNAASSGDLVETVSFFVSSVINAIPAVAGAVTNAYLLDGSITKAKMAASGAWAPAGTVVQVVQGTFSNIQETTTSTSFVDTSVNASITPSSASSKILVLVTSQWHTAAINRYIGFAIKRNSTDVASGINYFGQTTTWGAVSISYLDSPSSASSVTYTLRFKSNDGAVVTHGWGSSGGGSTQNIVLMEIAG
jgi:hypothetical protein